MPAVKTWITRKVHLKSEREKGPPPFADSCFQSPKRGQESAQPYPNLTRTPKPNPDDHFDADVGSVDGPKTHDVTKNIVAGKAQSDGVSSVMVRASDRTVEVHPDEITHLNLNLLRKRASTWIQSKFYTRLLHAAGPGHKIAISEASGDLSTPRPASTNVCPSQQGPGNAIVFDPKPSEQSVAKERLAVVKAQNAALDNTTYKSEKEQPQSLPTPHSQSQQKKLRQRQPAEPVLSSHLRGRASSACLVDTTLFLNDVHVEELSDGRPSIYVHVCQNCDLPGVIFPIKESRADAEDEQNFGVKVEKGNCMSCGWSYELRHEMYDGVGVENLQKYRLEKRFIALRGDKYSNSPQAPNLLPLPTYDWHTLLPSVLQWGADNKWWKYKPPAQPSIVAYPSLRGATFVDDVLYLNDVTRVTETLAVPGRPTTHRSIFDYVCPRCQHARVTFDYSDPKHAPIRKDSSVMASRTQTSACPYCHHEYTLRFELLNGEALHELRVCRLNQIFDCFRTGAWRNGQFPPATFRTYFPSRQHILINDVYIVDITGQADLNAENPRYAFGCSHHAHGKWQSEHQVFFEFRKHERRPKPDGEALCQRGRCGDCGGQWVLWYVEVPREEAARVKAARR